MQPKIKAFVQNLDRTSNHDNEEAWEALDESLSMIGLVVMCFNRLEGFVGSCVCEAISDRSDSMGLLVLAGMQYVSKIELMARIYDEAHLTYGATPLAYRGLVDKLKEAGRLRNVVVHADWASTDGDGYTFHRARLVRGAFQQEYLQLGPAELDAVVEAIEAAAAQLDQYCEDWGVLTWALRNSRWPD